MIMDNFSTSGISASSQAPVQQAQHRLLLVVDDCPLVLFQWRRLLTDRVVTIETPRELRDLCEHKSSLVKSATGAVIDYFFAKDMNGEQVAATLKEAGFVGKMVFASDAPEGALPEGLMRVPKDPLEACRLV